MSDELRVVIFGSGGLPDESRATLEKVVREHGVRILEDAERIEKARRIDPGRPMITDTTIALADLNTRNGQTRTTKSGRAKFFAIVQYVATFASGGFAGYIATPIGAIGFAACAAIGVLAHNWTANGE